MTMQMMKTTASTGPTTQMRPSPPVSMGRGSPSTSGIMYVSVYGLDTNAFYEVGEKEMETRGRQLDSDNMAALAVNWEALWNSNETHG